MNTWVTADTKSIHIWNLETEKVTTSMKSSLFEKGIIGLEEINYLKVVAIATQDNVICKNLYILT